MGDRQIRCFQDLWSITIGQSSLQDSTLVEKELFDSISFLRRGLNHFKEYSDTSIKQLKGQENISENLSKFLSKSAKFLNVDGRQLYKIYNNFSTFYFHGSKDKIKQMLSDEKSSQTLLSDLSNYYFIERLYLLRTLGQIIGFFEDKNHSLQPVYSNVLQSLPDIIPTLEKQLEDSLKAKTPTLSTLAPMQGNELQTRLALQRVKEQCEILELIFLYHSQYAMTNIKLLKLAKLFKEYGFGFDHPMVGIVDPTLLNPLLSCMNALQQLILIEGFGMEFLMFQDSDTSEDHNLMKSKGIFDQINDIIVCTVDQQQLSPLLVSWATVRHLLLPDKGGTLSQKLGERAVSFKVWQQMSQLLTVYPFNTNSNVSAACKKVLLDVFSCLIRTFHEDTLGDYAELISLATLLLGDASESGGYGIENSGLDLLLASSAGYFPLYIEPMLSLLSCMVKTRKDSMQVHAFVSNLPVFAEYIATCGRDDVESLEDASVWRLLTSKPIRTAGGLQTIQLPVGTIGQLVDSQYGAMVQWQRTVNGFKVFNAELKNLLDYQGPSSNLELLGYFQKSELIYKLIENILAPLKELPDASSASMAVVECLEVFILKFHRVIQRVVLTTSPPLKLIEHCLRSAIAWIKINPEVNLLVIIDQLSQIQFFPSKEQLSFSAVPSNSSNLGIYGMLLAESERVNGCFHVTIATIELITACLECSLEQNESIVTYLTFPVEFLLTNVFSSYQQWQKNDVESWENIGLRCLEMCHVILSTSTDVNSSDTARKRLQEIVINILLQSSVADVILKLSCLHVNTLHALMASEPTSSVVVRLNETIRIGFSLLNNLLRLERSLTSSGDSEERSYLHRALATPSTSGDNLISVVAGYIYHRQNAALPRLATALLRRISLVAPMSLHACLGPDVAAIRDILLSRLESRSEDNSLKIGILELFVVCVQDQPSLLELFLDLKPVDKEKADSGLTLGKSSCLSVVLNMITPPKQGSHLLPPRLHTACVKLLNTLWVGRRHSALQALRRASVNEGRGFWSSVLLPLFSENAPRDIAQGELFETCAHVLNIVALERFYTTRCENDEALLEVLKEFKVKKRYEHWSKVLLCVTKTLMTSRPFERRRHLMFASAWRSFVTTVKIIDLDLIDKIVDDVINAILFLVNDLHESSDVTTVLDLTSSLLLTLVSKQTRNRKSEKVGQQLPSIVTCIEGVYELASQSRVSCHLYAVAVLIINSISWKSDDVQVSNLIRITCQHLSILLRDLNPDTFKNAQIPLLLVGLLATLFIEDDDKINQSWMRIVSRESTIHLLVNVLVIALSSRRENADLVQLCIAISRFLSTLSLHESSARILHNTGCFPQLCLNLTNTYNNTDKKWLEVYHLNLLLMSRMTATLSHDFINDALDFTGVHQDRLVHCLSIIRLNQNSSVLREAIQTTSLLAALSRGFTHQWRYKLPHTFECLLKHVLSTTHSCVAMVLQPRLLLKTTKLLEKRETPPKNSTSKRILAVRKSLSRSMDEDSLTPEASHIQQRLFSILANCLDFLYNFSPNICQILLDQGTDPDEYMPLLGASFASPTLDQEPVATFGVVISSANLALSNMHKIDAADEKQATYLETLTFVADTALVLLMSQCLLLLKQTNITYRSKQLVKRELTDELSSCVRSASRHLRHSSSSFSPHSSPIQLQPVPSTSRSPASSNKGILDLVNAFVKQLIS